MIFERNDVGAVSARIPLLLTKTRYAEETGDRTGEISIDGLRRPTKRPA
jgi:hypothetical protein